MGEIETNLRSQPNIVSKAAVPFAQLASGAHTTQKLIIFVYAPRYPSVETFIVVDRPNILYVNKSCAGQGVAKMIAPPRHRR